MSREIQMLGFHFLILGAVLAFVGSFLSIKSILHQPYSDELASTFLGKNPYQVRNGIIQQIEAICGTVLMGVSLLIIVAGTVLTTSGITQHNIFGFWIDILVYLIAGVGLLSILLEFTKQVSRHIYLPKMIESQAELYRLSVECLNNDERRDHEVSSGTSVDSSTRKQRLEEAERRLEQVGQLVDRPRMHGETLKAFIARLEPLYERETGH